MGTPLGVLFHIHRDKGQFTVWPTNIQHIIHSRCQTETGPHCPLGRNLQQAPQKRYRASTHQHAKPAYELKKPKKLPPFGESFSVYLLSQQLNYFLML